MLNRHTNHKPPNNSQSFPMKSSLYIIISAFFFSSYGIWSKLMVGFGEFSQAWTRALILLIILIPFGFVTKSFKTIQKPDRKWFAIIALSAGLNQAPYFLGFHYLNVGTATLLFYVMLTLGAFLIGKFSFNEQIDHVKILSLGLGVLGLFIMYRFELTPEQVIPAFLVCLAGLMGATSVVFSKKISDKYAETQILTITFLVMLVVNFILSQIFTSPLPEIANTQPWLAQLGYAISMLLANVTVIAGFKHIQPSIGALLGLLEIVFAVILGIILFGEVVTVSMIVGGGLLILAAGLVEVVGVVRGRKV